jgi:hypothetical protein
MTSHSLHHSAKARPHSSKGHYGHLLVMAGLSFVAMYILMYAMVDSVRNVYPNFNQLYMAGLMTAPMVIIELCLMRTMYPNRKANALILGASVFALIVFFGLIQRQIAISDRQFLKSMIPHHAAAILMCEQTRLHDPEIQQLCKTIISSQQGEIDQMKAKLQQLEK